MMELVFRVVDLIEFMKFRKRSDVADSQRRNEHPTIDESQIDLELTECWVVMGPGIPLINGTYQFQREHTKDCAEELCSLINIISGNGGKWARNSMKSSFGIEGHEQDIAWENFEAGRKYRLLPGEPTIWRSGEYTPANVQAARFRAARRRIKHLEQEIEQLKLILQEPKVEAEPPPEGETS